MGLNIIKNMPKYVLTPDEDDDFLSFHTFLSGIKDNLEEVNDEFTHLKFALGADERGEVYLYPALDDVFVTIGYNDYALSDILDKDFYINYNDNSDMFKDDYDRVLTELKDDFKKSEKLIKQFANDWGFKQKSGEWVNLSEALSEDDFTLEYNDLHVEFYYSRRGRDYLYDNDISYSYKVPKEDVEDTLAFDILSKDDKLAELSDNDYFKYIKDNFEKLAEEHYDELLKLYRHEAEEEATEEMINDSSDNFDDDYDY